MYLLSYFSLKVCYYYCSCIVSFRPRHYDCIDKHFFKSAKTFIQKVMNRITINSHKLKKRILLAFFDVVSSYILDSSQCINSKKHNRSKLKVLPNKVGIYFQHNIYWNIKVSIWSYGDLIVFVIRDFPPTYLV